jgi:class 3 adenylate cyclase
MVDGTTNNAWLEISDRGTHKLNGGCSIGRSSVNQVVLAAEKVSRRHAIINAADNGEFWLVDLESSTELSVFYPPDELPKVTGRWLDRCKAIIETNDGTINKFLGDGFFAYWRHHDGVEKEVATCVEKLRELQAEKDPSFRVVLHYGRVFSGGSATMGEESLSGKEVNFIFRMEKKAPEIGISRIMSQPAQQKLEKLLKGKDVGSHGLSGFEGEFPFFEF